MTNREAWEKIELYCQKNKTSISELSKELGLCNTSALGARRAGKAPNVKLLYSNKHIFTDDEIFLFLKSKENISSEEDRVMRSLKISKEARETSRFKRKQIRLMKRI